ncbi:hypothetical protein L1987_77667 [Smallanthus sonchifolius]|uniref:Uncharacterized protein n=1 Tax=Smallanthus sonchifolius TaxID=185202 RepID=A0ACB8ZBH7_9ASTR|nr:hypothetical protein L1987_77667 [Smallanthus sonchifolius]
MTLVDSGTKNWDSPKPISIVGSTGSIGTHVVLSHNQPGLLNVFTIFLPGYSDTTSSHCVHSSRTHKPRLGDRSSLIGTLKPLHSGSMQKSKVKPDVVSYALLISAYGNARREEEALALF